MRTQVPEPDLVTIWAVSPPTMVTKDEGGHDSFKDEMWHITGNIRLQGKRPGGDSPEMSTPTSILGEICPQALTETSILHYKDNTVIVGRGNGRETMISSREWNGNRAPAHCVSKCGKWSKTNQQPTPNDNSGEWWSSFAVLVSNFQ